VGQGILPIFIVIIILCLEYTPRKNRGVRRVVVKMIQIHRADALRPGRKIPGRPAGPPAAPIERYFGRACPMLVFICIVPLRYVRFLW